jgi:type I restriction enzyme S subunit
MEYQRYQLRDIGDIVSGATPKTTVAENFGGAIPWLTPADLSGYTQKYISRGKRNLTQLGYDSCSTQIMPSGTVLFSSRAPIGYTAIAKNPICTNQGFKSIVPKPFVNSEFLYYQLIYLRKTIQDMGSGTTFKEISAKKFGAVQVTIPPLVEQEHIISRIEELFSQLDASVAELKTAKERLKVYRQAVLKEAFEGDYPQVQLKEISTAISGYAFKSKLYTSDGKYIVVKIGNVKERHFEFSRDLTRTNEADETILDKYLLQRGDCLITLTGSRGKRDYGFVTMIKDQTNYLLNQRVAAIRFNRKEAIPEFFQYYLASPSYRSAFFRYETGNVGQGNVGIKALTEPIVILPNIEQQWRIVEEIESRLSVCDSIEKTVDTALQQAEALRQSILKKAFEGEMV